MSSTTDHRRACPPRRRSPRTSRLAIALSAALTLTALGIGTAGAASAESGPYGFGGPASPSGAPLGALPGALPTATTPTTPAVPVPATPAGLPVGIESLQPYVAASSCDPLDKTGPQRLGDLLVATYPGTSYGISRPCGSDSLSTSEHYEGRALDWMTSVRDPQGAARAQAVLDWLLATDSAGNPYANLRRLGIMYVIWDDRIWGSYAPGDGWRPYSTCASHPDPSWDTTCHRNHVHVSFGWNGAQARTSFFSKAVATPDYGPCRPPDLNWAAPWSAARATRCPSYTAVSAAPGASALLVRLTRFSGAQVGRGQTGPVVAAVQQVLGVTADGDFGPATLAALHGWQTAHAVPTSDAVDAATWRAILTAQTVLEKASGPAGSTPAAPTGGAATAG